MIQLFCLNLQVGSAQAAGHSLSNSRFSSLRGVTDVFGKYHRHTKIAGDKMACSKNNLKSGTQLSASLSA